MLLKPPVQKWRPSEKKFENRLPGPSNCSGRDPSLLLGISAAGCRCLRWAQARSRPLNVLFCLLFFYPEIIGDRKDVWYALGLDLGDLFVHLPGNDAL
jgi:hypothetical protein